MGKKILFLISESFPFGKAYAARTRSLVKLFEQAGASVTVFCDEISEGSTEEKYNVYVPDQRKYGSIGKLLKYPKDYAREVDKLLQKEQFDIVVSRSMFDRFPLVRKVVKSHNIPLILESCECYDKKTFGTGVHKIRYFQFNSCWKNDYNKADGYIAISRYLSNHYNKLNKPVLRIPAILNTERRDFKPHTGDGKKIKLIYSGDITGGKELMGDIIRALNKANEKGKIRFDIYGPSQKQLEESLSESDKELCTVLQNRGFINIHGRIPQQEMLEVIDRGDFGIFIRPNRISSEAGFPTKMGEYLSAGLPIITNNTGDISLVIRNGENGYIVNEPIENSLVSIFQELIEMRPNEISRMSSAARKAAVECLDPSAYIQETKRYLSMF